MTYKTIIMRDVEMTKAMTTMLTTTIIPSDKRKWKMRAQDAIKLTVSLFSDCESAHLYLSHHYFSHL